MVDTYDIVIIGGGPGGYVAAVRASQLGYKVAVVEKEALGGVCLNWGCIPTKALLRSSEIYSFLKNAESFGLSASDISFDFKKVIERSRKVSKQLSSGIDYLMKKNNIKVYNGSGTITKDKTVKVTDFNSNVIAILQAKYIIIATGAQAKEIPGFEIDDECILGYKGALSLTEKPSDVLIIGAGAMGVEFASFYAAFGSNAHVVDIADRIVPTEDPEISELLYKSLQRCKDSKDGGINIQTKVKELKVIKKSKGKIQVSIDGKKLDFSHVILAVGIKPNVEKLGLEDLKIEKDKRGFIVTDQWLNTNVQGVYAIGDVTTMPALAHKASHEGVICIEKIASIEGKYKDKVEPLNKENIPMCTYCHPQVASVGLTEEAAKKQGNNIKVGRFNVAGNGKAVALGEAEGLIKVIFDKDTGELLGAHMIGPEVTEMIQGFAIGKTLEATDKDFKHVIFPHPTLSEMMHEAVLDADDEAIHS